MAKSKMAVVASPESPQDAAQNVISEPGNQEEISALAYELWIQRGCPNKQRQRGVDHGRNETSKMRTSGLRMPGGRGQQILQALVQTQADR